MIGRTTPRLSFFLGRKKEAKNNMKLASRAGWLAGLALLAGLCWIIPARADDEEIVSSEEIRSILTRNINITPAGTSTQYAVPEMSPHISLNTILFDLNSTRLRPQAIRQLDEVVTALKSEGVRDRRLAIEGHTCDRGATEHNHALSEGRAQAVKVYLVQHGIAPDRLETAGHGEIRPVAPNLTESLRRLNRRVDFIKLESAALPPPTGVRTRSITTRGLGEDRFLKVKFLGMKKGSSSTFPLTSANNELQSGDMFRVEFTVLEGCHVYILFRSSQGEVEWLFPKEDVKYGRWCYFGQEHHLPGENEMYVLDANVGEEVIYIIASPSPLPKADALAGLLRQHGKGLSADTLRSTAAAGAEVHALAVNHKVALGGHVVGREGKRNAQ